MNVTRPPLVQLVSLLMAHSPIHVVFGTLEHSEDERFLYEQVMDFESPVGNDLLNDVADQLVAAWFGMPRWTVQEIWWRVLGAWAEIDGELQMRGVDLISLPPATATNTAKSVLTKWVSGDEDKRAAFYSDLTTEPPRILLKSRTDESTPEANEAEGYDFMAALELANQHQR